MTNDGPLLYDVFLVYRESRRIDAMVVRRAQFSDGYHSAIRHRNTWAERITDNLVVEIARSGKFKRGEVLPIEECLACEPN